MRLTISSYIILDLQWLLNPGGVSIRDRDDDVETHGGRALGDTGRDWSDLSQATERQGLPGVPNTGREAGDTCSLRASGEDPPCPHLHFGLWPPDLCFESLSL